MIKTGNVKFGQHVKYWNSTFMHVPIQRSRKTLTKKNVFWEINKKCQIIWLYPVRLNILNISVNSF